MRNRRETPSTLISPGSIVRSRVALGMERVGEHAVPVGPLAVRWLAYELEDARAGVEGRARVRLENAGSAAWRSRGKEGVQLGVSLARPARKSDRVGRHPSAAAARRRAGRGGRARRDGRRTAPARELPTRVRSRGGVPLLVRGGRIDAARPPGRGGAADRRAATPGRTPWPFRPRDRCGSGRAGGAARLRGRSRVRASRSRSLTRSRLVAIAARRASGGLRGGRSCARGIPRGTAPLRRHGLPAEVGIRASRSRSSCLRSWRASSRRPTSGMPSFSGADALFEGRAVVRLRPRSDRPSD